MSRAALTEASLAPVLVVFCWHGRSRTVTTLKRKRGESALRSPVQVGPGAHRSAHSYLWRVASGFLPPS